MNVESSQFDNVTDADLLLAYASGDSQAFSIIVRRYKNRLFAFLYQMTNSTNDADDLFQETFIRVHRFAKDFDKSRQFRPWLFAIAVNAARDFFRKKSRSPILLESNLISDSKSILADAVDKENCKKNDSQQNLVNQQDKVNVQNIVESLPADLHEVLILSYFAELPYSDIAEILNIPVGTVKSRVNRAIKKLAEKYNRIHQDSQNG